MHEVDVSAGEWLNPPASVIDDGETLVVAAEPHSDFWRSTSYNFIHDNGHALLNDFADGTAVEVSWILDYDQQFDQAGIMVWHDDRNWMKAGVEFADGAPQLGAVVTREVSDWSVAPVADWAGREVHLRVSRRGDALTVRARCDGPWQLVRLAPLEASVSWRAGLFLASPSRSGLVVTFTRRLVGAADDALH